MSSSRILITGATGLLGGHALRRIERRDAEVTATCRGEAPKGGGRVVWRRCDLASPAARDDLAEIAPAVVVHGAAVLPGAFHGEAAERVAAQNRRIDDAVIGHCRASGCRLVYLSGTSVYGAELAGLTDESAPVGPMGPYVAGKAESERRIAAELDGYAILRVSAPYGPGQRARTVLQLFIEKALAGDDLTYFGSGRREQDFIAAADVARAIEAAAFSRPSGIFNIASGEPVTMQALAEMIVAEAESESRVVAAGRPDPQEGYRAAFDIRKAAEELDWRPEVPLAEGIRTVIAHHRQS